MSEVPLVAISLAFLVPAGYALIAAGGLPEERARQVALSLLSAFGLTAFGYIAVGFALQFGGIGLLYNRAGYEGLIWEWSALGPSWGAGWGMAGVTGWGMAGAAANSAAYALALANLPWVTTAALIPLAALRGRIPAWAAGLIGLLVGAIVYPLAGNWIWGGGWLANLGSNLGRGHGLVDAGGAGLVHVLGAAAALAGMAVFWERMPSTGSGPGPVPLPPVHMPMLAVLGAGLLVAGNLSWTVSNPLLAGSGLDAVQIALNGALAAAGGALAPVLYTWFVAGRADPLMAARGCAAGSITGAALAPFVPPVWCLAAGAAIGCSMPLVVFFVERILRLEDPTAALSVHGLAGTLGLLGVGVLADGRAGLNWNGVGASAYLGVARQGVTGLLAAAGRQPDWPGQLEAQAIGLAALALFGFFTAWAVTAPPAVLMHLMQHWSGRLPAVTLRPVTLAGQRARRLPPARSGDLRAPGPADSLHMVVRSRNRRHHTKARRLRPRRDVRYMRSA